jgi:hypothetical protein
MTGKICFTGPIEKETLSSEDTRMSLKDQDVRGKEPPVPENLDDYLNDAQTEALEKLQAMDWYVKFVRRPPAKDPTVVLYNKDGRSIGILEADGRINVDIEIEIRK